MGPFQIIQDIRTELGTFAGETLQAAALPMDQWDAYMKSHDLAPKTEDERNELKALKESAVTGPLPIEVRAILEKQKSRANHKLQELKDQFGNEEWWKRVEEPAKKLINDFVEEGVKKYIGKIDSTRLTTADIISKSIETTAKYYTEVHKSGTRSEKCPSCLSARAEGSDLRVCAFCGSPLFNA